MEKIIIYGSKYGSTQKYALALSQKTGIDVIEYNKVKELKSYSTIIYMGGLYAGGILGLSDILKKFPITKEQKLIIVTVGLSDPENKENTENIKNSLSKQLPEELLDNCTVFHLRGGIDYSKLNVIHKIMMKALYNKTKKIPVEKQSEEAKALVETYNKKVNFYDVDSLNKIIEFI